MDVSKLPSYGKTMMVILLLGVVVGLAVGVVVGIQLFQVSTVKLGFWESKVEATHIVLYSLRHQILGSDSVRTSVSLGNTGVGTISCNCTLYYKSVVGEQIAEYSFNVSVNAGQTRNTAFTVTSINVSDFAGTDVSIFEY